MNILYSTFQKWVKSIPQIGYFQIIRDQLINKIPINLMLKNGEYNPYLGETKFRLRTKSELIEMLVNLTKTTLITVSNERGSVALEEGSKSHYLEVLVENHRLKQNQLLIDYDKGERAYIKILKQWLKNEKQFFESFHNLSSKDRLFFVPKLSSSELCDSGDWGKFTRAKANVALDEQCVADFQKHAPDAEWQNLERIEALGNRNARGETDATQPKENSQTPVGK